MLKRITLTLEQSENSTLIEEALRELRTPEAQALHILRIELNRLTTQRDDSDEILARLPSSKPAKKE